nr:MAG TPA: hypothetical protein [Caudoviricetes sp.]
MGAFLYPLSVYYVMIRIRIILIKSPEHLPTLRNNFHVGNR